jgi:predicted Holliday junction resolvase-like endonuclease
MINIYFLICIFFLFLIIINIWNNINKIDDEIELDIIKMLEEKKINKNKKKINKQDKYILSLINNSKKK